MNAPGQKIEAFIARSMVEGADRVTLTRATRDSQATVATCEVEEGETDPEAVAASFLSRAEDFIDDDPNTKQRFLVIAWANGSPSQQMPLSMASGGEGIAKIVEAVAADEGSPRGLVRDASRMLRHRDAASRKMLNELVRSLQGENARKSKRISQLEDRNQKMMDRHFELVDVLEKAKSLAHERSMAQMEAEQQQHTRAWMIGKLETFLPVLMSNLTGAPEVSKLVKSIDVSKLVTAIQAADWTPDEVAAMQRFIAIANEGEAAKLRLASSDGEPVGSETG